MKDIVIDNRALLVLRWLTKWYGRVVRFTLHRVVAVWFMALGSLMTLMDGLWVLMGKLTDADGHPSGILARVAYVGMPLLGALVGWALWRVYPYRQKPRQADLPAKNPWE